MGCGRGNKGEFLSSMVAGFTRTYCKENKMMTRADVDRVVRILDQDMLTEFKELCQELDMAYEKIERLELAVNELNFAIETLLEGDKDV
jgi:hypothetical protein